MQLPPQILSEFNSKNYKIGPLVTKFCHFALGGPVFMAYHVGRRMVVARWNCTRMGVESKSNWNRIEVESQSNDSRIVLVTTAVRWKFDESRDLYCRPTAIFTQVLPVVVVVTGNSGGSSRTRMMEKKAVPLTSPVNRSRKVSASTASVESRSRVQRRSYSPRNRGGGMVQGPFATGKKKL